MVVAVLATTGLTTGPAQADDLGDPTVPGLGNVADVLYGPAPEQQAEQHPVQQQPAQQQPAQQEPEQRAHATSEIAPTAPAEGNPGAPGPQAPDAPGPQGPAVAQAQAAPGAPAAPDRAALESQLLTSTNQARAANGCVALTPDWHLASSAQQHSDDMASHSYFSHSSLDGQTFDHRIRDTGYDGPAVGENIASGFDSAPEVENAWMDSPAHRKNILDCEFHSVGIGYDQQGGYWTVDFGS